MSSCLRVQSPVACLILLSPLSARADTYRLILPRNAPAPLQFGAEEMARDLAEAGHHTGQGRRGIAITVTTSGPGGPEAFALQRRGAALRVAGGDAVGAMYGLIEIGEQVTAAGGQGLLQAVRPVIRRPYLPLRADSPTLWLDAQGGPPAILSDSAFWRRYLAGPARGRYNVLHLHGFVDPATGRSQSLLERLMPAAGAPDAAARQAVRGLTTLAGLCRERGLRLAVTDDAATEAPAAVASARRLVVAVPGLWGLGARATGPGASALLAALARAVSPRVLLAWPAPQSLGDPIASLPRRSLAILPLNAGAFALPYPLLDVRDAGPRADAEARFGETMPLAATAASSFADPRLLQATRLQGNRLLWDVPAGRAAPCLPWGDPGYIRRLVRAVAMATLDPAGAPGLLIEPPASLFSSLIPHPSSLVSPWWWHRMWGRLAYDPSEPDQRLEEAFQHRYGAEPGWRIARTLARVSAVVPLLATVHPAPPEHKGPWVPEWEPGTLEEWAAGPALDPQAIADVPTWAEMRLNGEADGRLDPVRISFLLAETAMRTRNEVDTIEILQPRRRAEWRELRRQMEALCHLADFGARRLSTAAHLELYRQTGDEMELELASGHDPLAAISWAAMQRLLAPGGEREVGQMSLPSELPALEGPFAPDTATFASLRAELQQELLLPRAAPRIAHVPVLRATPTRAQRITATVMSGPNPPVVTLVYRLLDRAGQCGPAQERAMTRLFDTQAFYQAEIQGPELTEGFLEYRIRATGGFGAEAFWPGRDSWRRVPVTRDEAGPAIRPLRPVATGGSAVLACELTDLSGVGRVRLHYRPLAAREPWRMLEMMLAGTRYTAQVPLTADGLQYRFDATDAWGNPSLSPDPGVEMPSLILLPRTGLARNALRFPDAGDAKGR